MSLRTAAITMTMAMALVGCDQLTSGTKAAPDPAAIEPVVEVQSPLVEAKSSGTIVYEGGSLGVEVPKPLVYYYATTGALVVSGELIDPAAFAKTGGASFAVSEEAEKLFSGKTIKIKIVSSAAQPGEAAMAYSTNEVGNSGWIPFPVTTEDSVAVIEYAVPTMTAGLGDFIGIDPKGNELTIKAIVIDVAG